MKKGICVLLCMVILCGLCACGKENAIQANDTTFLVDHYKNEYLCDSVICFEAKYEKTYRIELYGYFLNGFLACAVEVNDGE